uniref:interleukin-1 family member A n=1 Tax=Doryrhamphus excisus TaxID=161450 RepID=UPI0025AEAF9F|nr:interleukin-1 family member A [Doryrhamphus excisus]
MDVMESLINGSVLIVHQLHQGKHQYEVENVVQYQKSSGPKQMMRRGDKLVQINGTDLQDYTPKELAQAIAEGCPKLTVHKQGSQSKKQHKDQLCSVEDALHPVSKERALLQFSMEMLREEDLQESESGSRNDAEDNDICPVEDEEKKQDNDLLVVTMNKTSISVIRGRGCDAGSACRGCPGTGCSFSDIVMVSESSTVTLVSRGGGSFKHLKSLDTPIEHVASNKYLRGICSQKTLYASPHPEKMTIYYYKSTCLTPYFPVVLNFTGSDCFLRCSKRGEQVLLQVETCDKQRLRSISMNDETTLSYVFYMKTDPTSQRRFESALYRGWYIQIVTSDATDSVKMAELQEPRECQPFLFIIQT